MRHVYFYRIKKKDHRGMIDLLLHAIEIIMGVTLAMGDDLVEGSIRVEKDYFSFELKNFVRNARLRQMGKNISFIEREIRKYVTTYGKSRQLFVRMTEKQINDIV